MTNLHQEMGYDRAITMFSPDGRLLQVEYARKTVENGNDALGFVCKEGVLLVSTKKLTNPLMITGSVEKSYIIDDHIISVSSGLLSDSRVLIDKARIFSQENRLKFQSPVDTLSLVKYIADIKQYTTQTGSMRPFGVSFLIGGVDLTGKRLFVTDPVGIYFEYRATAIGKNEKTINEKLIEKYKDNTSMKDTMLLSLNILKEVQGEDFDMKSLDVILVEEKDQKSKFFSGEEILNFFDIHINK